MLAVCCLLIAFLVAPTITQGIPSGNIGGGGDGGGGGRGEDDHDRCHVNGCSRCQSSNPYCCASCSTGYVRNTCHCAACAANCYSCESVGAGSCDVCDSGYMRSPSALDERKRSAPACLPCSYRCSRCHNQTAAGCEACFWLYSLRDEEEGCHFSWVRLGVTLSAVFSPIVYWCTRRVTRRRRRSLPPPTIDEFIGPAEHGGVAASYPSGRWRGYYTHVGGRQHGVVEFTLEFGVNGVVTGGGVDDVGKYELRGRTAADGKVALRKQYVRGSLTAGGHLSAENLGHTVEYRGEPARRLPNLEPSLSGGLKGCWTIRHEQFDGDGRWHLWPVVLPAGALGGAGGDSGGASGDGEGDNECCVCFDRRIDTCLQPCGHVALCHACATRLANRRCPLCRAEILDVVRTTP